MLGMAASVTPISMRVQRPPGQTPPGPATHGQPMDGIDQLYEKHHRMVFATAYRVTGNAADAEDVLHTVFLRLLRRPDAVSIENAEGYLRRSAVNAGIDLVRARRDSPDIDLDRMAGSGPDPDRSDLGKHLRQAMATLPQRSAEIFALRFFEGWTNPQIAKALGMSQMVVAVIVHRTRKKLQQDLTKMGVKP